MQIHWDIGLILLSLLVAMFGSFHRACTCATHARFIRQVKLVLANRWWCYARHGNLVYALYRHAGIPPAD